MLTKAELKAYVDKARQDGRTGENAPPPSREYLREIATRTAEFRRQQARDRAARSLSQDRTRKRGTHGARRASARRR